MNKEDFCSYELSLKLKEAGFNWECYEFWDTHFSDDGTPIKIRKTQSEPKVCVMSECNSILDYIGSDLITAPTLAKAAKWLRDEHGIDLDIVVRYTPINKSKLYAVNIGCIEDDVVNHIYLFERGDYKIALSDGICEALKQIKK